MRVRLILFSDIDFRTYGVEMFLDKTVMFDIVDAFWDNKGTLAESASFNHAEKTVSLVLKLGTDFESR